MFRAMSVSPELSVDAVRALYERQAQQHEWARKLLGRPLTYTEKVLFSHMRQDEVASKEDVRRRKSSARLWPDRVALQDATAQMALLQFMQSGIKRAAVPSTIHCDHLIRAETGAKADLLRAFDENQEVYDFLASAGRKYGLGFWKPGSGIIHQVVLENYACPGTMMLGTDSHTPNAGGLGMIAVGVGGADAVDVMVGMPFGVRMPGVIGVRLTGSLKGWTAPKDVILRLLGILTVKGGTGHVVEFFGPGAANLSCTGKGTICNMGAEHGATTSTFPFDESMATYLRATGRAEIADLAEKHAAELVSDPEVDGNADQFYDRVVEIDLDTLEPHLNGPHSPDRAMPISEVAKHVEAEGWPDELKACLIGSCTNSSYEDMTRAAEIMKAAAGAGVSLQSPLLVSPGSDQIHNTIERDGQLATFRENGATVLANACGPCIGQWKRSDIKTGDVNSIVNSFNRNFKGRNDGNRDTLSFIASPETVAALALAGRLSFNPLTDELEGKNGPVLLSVPQPAPNEGLPAKGFEAGLAGFDTPVPVSECDDIDVVIDPTSERLEVLEPFDAWDGKDYEGLPVLLRAVGKCTTDHISPAGKWLKFRGHLNNISNNMFSGAINAFSDEPGTALNVLTGDRNVNIPDVARAYKAQGLGWAVFGDENYGEGSSREHAAMSPRLLGAKVVVAKSFARIHETNLKKQGVIGATFVDNADYEKVQAKDRVALRGLTTLAPEENLTIVLTHEDGSTDEFEVAHTLTAEQIEWFKAGSALNAFGNAR
jgi:aconitate hydratase